jgi:hypothetical protein
MIIPIAIFMLQEYVTDTRRAVAIDTERPGMEPTNKPAAEPAKTIKIKRMSKK